MSNRFADNQAVLKALGLDHLKRVTAINIRLRSDRFPTVIVWQTAEDNFTALPAQKFHLVPAEETDTTKADL